MIKLTCENCGKKLEAPDEAEGKKGRCPYCRTIFALPKEDDENAGVPGRAKALAMAQTLERLFDADYGVQNAVDRPAFDREWFTRFKNHYDRKEADLAIAVLDEAFEKDRSDGLLWYWYGEVHADLYSSNEDALRYYLTGAKTCESSKTNLLQGAAERLLLDRNDVENATKLFFKTILSVSQSTKAWGNAMAGLTQERAFLFLRAILEYYGFKQYSAYIVSKVSLATSMDYAYKQKILNVLRSHGDKEGMSRLIEGMFPELKNKIEQLT